VQQVGSTTFKLRGSYGRAIRPPSPGQKFALSSPSSATLANPALGPERQSGWDAGLDVAVGARGSLSLTYYNQTAEDLIQYVLLQAAPLPTSQYQNVGRVKNVGVEVEGMFSAGPVKVKAQYGYARSRIEELPPSYGGDLRVGDQSLGTPKHTAGGALTLAAFRGTHLAAGVTYVGSWRYYDFLAEFRCFGGTGPCQPTLRDYIIDYPAFIKVHATATQQITGWLAGFISVENATNRTTPEFSTLIPVTGRITTVGFRVER
jgi:outer membrane receptor protein involved in Fe transport